MKHKSPILLHISLLLLLLQILFPNAAEAGKTKIHITDDLDDVVDDEEDENWKEWGKKKSPSDDDFDPPQIDDTTDIVKIQNELMRKQFGPAFGFVKLRLESQRTPDMVSDLAKRWTKLLKTGGLEVKFMGVDLSTVMFTMQRGGQDTLELKEYILTQPEAYEIKIGDQSFRRPGDIPLEELVAKRFREEQSKKAAAGDGDAAKSKDEL